MALKVGDEVPDLTVSSDKVGDVSLAGLRGKKVVLFFYPKDDTPGCTVESCEFRDLTGEFEKKNAVVLGVSADDLESHQKFAAKFNLNFPLLADTEQKLSRAFGVWGEQQWQGKTFMGIARTTFVIDENGRVQSIYRNVNPKGHPQQVLQDL